MPVKSGAPGKETKDVTLTLPAAALKDIRTVRLHYRPADSSGPSAVVERPAAASMNFTIAGADSDLIYYFEIINRENSGWFEPDPDDRYALLCDQN